jgi:hypothetical protein
MRRALAIAQGAYYVATGVWPLLSMRTFLKVTGPKRDLWLVKTVGTLVAVSGGVMLMAGLRRNVSPEIVALATGSAIGLSAVDINYSARGTISKIYLLDAGVELAVVGIWSRTAGRAAPSPAGGYALKYVRRAITYLKHPLVLRMKFR